MRKFGAETALQMIVMATLNGDVQANAVPVSSPAHRLLSEGAKRTERRGLWCRTGSPGVSDRL